MNDSTADESAMPAGQVVRVTTGTRLHFGLLDTAAPFGGVGVMIDHPQTEIVIRPARSFQCVDDTADRIVAIAERIRQPDTELPQCLIEVIKRAQPHSGLGSGTQLSMAVAEGLANFCGIRLSPACLASQIADRGKRSAVGVHGYFQGGLIYEDANDPRSSGTGELNAIKQRVAITNRWCVGLFQPSTPASRVSGGLEHNHFRSLEKTSRAKHQQLVSIINEHLIPAARSRDFSAFADAVRRYNYQSGLLFRGVQGGPYNGPIVSELVELLVAEGAVGVGQSSWGPTAFAWFEDAEQAENFQQRLPLSVKIVAIARALNRPRLLQVES